MIRHILLATLCAFLFSGCGSSRVAPLQIAQVRSALEASIGIINTGILREDPVLASQPVSSLFTMGGNVAVRYSEQSWEGTGVGRFREFFDSVFTNHANIFHQMTVGDIELVGDIASARVEVEFNSTRVDRVPPESYLAQGTDLLVFQREGGGWKLIAWDEAPPLPEPHNEGEAEDI